MVYGRPTPQFGEPTPTGAARASVGFTYIDDFGLLAIAECGRLDAVQEWSDRTTAELRVRGLDTHKVEVAEGLPGALGARITGRPYTIGIQRSKAIQLWKATMHLLSCLLYTSPSPRD
eukprot:6649948-Alexandrium_andersonii.AAC.1